MQIPKPTDDEKAAFRSLISDAPGVTVKPMFGSLGAFVNGNMFAGLFGSAVGVRLTDDASKSELESIEGTGSFGPAERPMKAYISLPTGWSNEQASVWIATALSQVAALPPKQGKA